MRLQASLLGGLAGACAVTILHEVMKRNIKDAPRMDKLGMQAIKKGLHKTNQPVPHENKLFLLSFMGELLSNTLYYSLTGMGKRKDATKQGKLLGLAAGLGALWLPKPMGLNDRHSNKTIKTKALALGLYFLGGLVASQVTKTLDRKLLMT